MRQDRHIATPHGTVRTASEQDADTLRLAATLAYEEGAAKARDTTGVRYHTCDSFRRQLRKLNGGPGDVLGHRKLLRMVEEEGLEAAMEHFSLANVSVP